MLTINKIDGMKGENVGGAIVTIENTITGKFYKLGDKKEGTIYYADEADEKKENDSGGGERNVSDTRKATEGEATDQT